MLYEQKPIERSKLRIILGQKYFILKRYLNWCTSSKVYVKKVENKKYPCVIFKHSTPLFRKLKDVDMYLQNNKVINLNLAIKRLNGILIHPGEIFSYWRIIGKPSYRKGYKDGVVLTYKGSFEAGVGGGLCQLSNLIYWMTLHTPLTVIERYRHSHDVFPDVNRTQPFGTGATCYYNYLDLQIENKTNENFQIILYTTENDLVGEWRSLHDSMYKYEVYEKDHSIKPGLFGAYIRRNTIYRKCYNLNNEIISDEYITDNNAYMTYAPYLE